MKHMIALFVILSFCGGAKVFAADESAANKDALIKLNYQILGMLGNEHQCVAVCNAQINLGNLPGGAPVYGDSLGKKLLVARDAEDIGTLFKRLKEECIKFKREIADKNQSKDIDGILELQGHSRYSYDDLEAKDICI